jgi:hypothetical protein
LNHKYMIRITKYVIIKDAVTYPSYSLFII